MITEQQLAEIFRGLRGAMRGTYSQRLAAVTEAEAQALGTPQEPEEITTDEENAESES